MSRDHTDQLRTLLRLIEEIRGTASDEFTAALTAVRSAVDTGATLTPSAAHGHEGTLTIAPSRHPNALEPAVLVASCSCGNWARHDPLLEGVSAEVVVRRRGPLEQQWSEHVVLASTVGPIPTAQETTP